MRKFRWTYTPDAVCLLPLETCTRGKCTGFSMFLLGSVWVRWDCTGWLLHALSCQNNVLPTAWLRECTPACVSPFSASLTFLCVYPIKTRYQFPNCLAKTLTEKRYSECRDLYPSHCGPSVTVNLIHAVHARWEKLRATQIQIQKKKI